jgi:hypothetical protein
MPSYRILHFRPLGITSLSLWHLEARSASAFQSSVRDVHWRKYASQEIIQYVESYIRHVYPDLTVSMAVGTLEGLLMPEHAPHKDIDHHVLVSRLNGQPDVKTLPDDQHIDRTLQPSDQLPSENTTMHCSLFKFSFEAQSSPLMSDASSHTGKYPASCLLPHIS